MLASPPTAWLVAAENDAIPGGKIGGVGDVIRDLPLALAREDWNVRVVVPAYGTFHRVTGAEPIALIRGYFSGKPFAAKAWRLPAPAGPGPGVVEQVVLDHPLLSPNEPGEIYHADPPDQPFATDAAKFAFFCAAVAAWLEQLPAPPNVLHLHDWHTGLLPWLRYRSNRESTLAETRMVFTIHNLFYQGVRPLAGTDSSLASWFPDAQDAQDPLRDTRDPSLVNFMATALRLADRISTVSPGYAREVVQPSRPELGFHGGEGLETLLQEAEKDKRLIGILNGCPYPEPPPPKPSWETLVNAILADRRIAPLAEPKRQLLEQLRDSRPATVLLNVGRVVDQKVDLFLEPAGAFPSALEAVLATLNERGFFLMLGSGDPALEARLREISDQHANFLFLNGYAQGLSDLLYGQADLFLMPSSFEPCGISQLLALRAGQPCVVHGVGGLADTIRDGETGFVFRGDTPGAQASAMVETLQRALTVRERAPKTWSALCAAAAAERFSWRAAARRTIDELYCP